MGARDREGRDSRVKTRYAIATTLALEAFVFCLDAGDGSDVWSYFFAVAFRRSAQYFFIRADTAFFCAADILERLRLGARVSDTSRAAFPILRCTPLEIAARWGNAFTSDATSA
jgi:hypothetical protein